MTRLTFFSFFIFSTTQLVGNFSFSQPDWVKSNGKSALYPEQLFLTGFSPTHLSGDNDKANCAQQAINNARGQLIQKIRVTLQTNVIGIKEESGKKFSEYFSFATQASSSLEIEGLQFDSFYDDDDEICYGFAFVKREVLIGSYNDKVKNLRKEIQSRLASGKHYEKQNNKTKAREEYLACYPLFQRLQEAQAIVTSARLSSAIESMFAELDTVVTEDEISLTKIREALERLVQKPIHNAEDFAWNIAYDLMEQLKITNASILVMPFIYRDTKMSSQFARYFKPILETKIFELAKWKIVQQASGIQPKSNDIAREFAVASGADYVLSGSYWEETGGIKFVVTLRNVDDGAITASVIASLDSSIVSDIPYSFKPENAVQALADQKVFSSGEVINGGLNLEVWTNKGNDNLVFTKGDTMQVYIRVNMPCYIRFIYHLADGKRALLLENHYIKEADVNRVYTNESLKFFCDAPFGGENLQVFARTEEKFEPVETVNIDGYDILKDDLKEFVPATRGFKKVKQNTMQAETRLVITTMEK